MGPFVAAIPPGAVVLDARKGDGYATRHLRGAHRADLETDLARPDDPRVGGRHPLPPLEDWARTLGRWGITPDTPVVVYDDRDGGLAAARAWWMLRAVGHTQAYVLAGDWRGAGEHTDEVPPEGDGSYPVTGWLWPIASDEDVDRARQDPSWRVVDARSAPRWRGEIEPFDPTPGRIPGSINIPWEELAPLDEVGRAERLAVLDVPTRRVIAHCGSGVTACHTILTLVEQGFAPPALYVGSYSAWCRQDRPIGAGP